MIIVCGLIPASRHLPQTLALNIRADKMVRHLDFDIVTVTRVLVSVGVQGHIGESPGEVDLFDNPAARAGQGSGGQGKGILRGGEGGRVVVVGGLGIHYSAVPSENARWAITSKTHPAITELSGMLWRVSYISRRLSSLNCISSTTSFAI